MKILKRHVLPLSLAISLPIMLQASVADSLADSANAKQQTKANYRIVARIHSLGVFGYGGMIANASPAFDITFSYQRKPWGFLVMKALDFYDSHSSYNFSLAMINVPLRLNKNLTVTPYGGLVIDQPALFIGPETDGMVFLITSWKRNNGITIEHCARFSNTCFETQYFDWLNRFRLLYTKQHFDVIASVWHNNNVFDQNKHTSIGLLIAYSRIKVSDQIALSTSITGIKMTANTNENDVRSSSGISLSIAATWH